MGTRAHLSARVAGVVLAAATALAVAAPGAPAAVARTSRPAIARAGPSGVAAAGAAIENAANGRLLWGRDLNTERPMASITKVMTALVVIRAGDLGRVITIPSAVVWYVDEHDASNAGLVPGDRLTARELLYALLLPSGADAAYALAEAYGPGLSAFIRKMNATAKHMGMMRTRFSNFDGLPYPTGYSTYSTPANLLTLGRAAMTLPVFRSVVHQRTYWLAAGSGHHAYYWRNLNPLLGWYPGTIGIKPGYTGPAGQCLLFEAVRNGYAVIGVTLDGPGSISTPDAADAVRMLNWAFARHG
jgi:serine-type D-Ala-D-Ala carboxypeptidase (penicillin-binding protein 5/6)